MEAERRLSASKISGAGAQSFGTGVQMYQLESETTGDFERGMNRDPQNACRPAETGLNRSAQPLATNAANTILSL